MALLRRRRPQMGSHAEQILDSDRLSGHHFLLGGRGRGNARGLGYHQPDRPVTKAFEKEKLSPLAHCELAATQQQQRRPQDDVIHFIAIFLSDLCSITHAIVSLNKTLSLTDPSI